MENQEQELRSTPKPQLERLASPSAIDATAPSGKTIPTLDAWLERRLRVFERALAQLETHQEQAQRDLARRIALLEERFSACEQLGAPESANVAEPQAAPHNPADMGETIVMASEPQTPLEQTELPQKPMGDFLIHARPQPMQPLSWRHPPNPRTAPRWMAWALVGSPP